MKKLILNISDSTYEKLRFEAMLERKSIQTVIHNRIFEKPFAGEVEQAFDEWLSEEVERMMKDGQ